MINFNTLNEIVSTLKEIGVLPSILFVGGALYTGILTLVLLVKCALYIVALLKKTEF
ncbi:MAG: hypothetical protein ACQEWV_22875 [Bacillota bacterium]